MITRLICLLPLTLALPKAALAETPATVYFASGDGHTELVGYLFSPAERGPHPAIVMLHGRSGPYSTNVNADCTWVARTVSSDCDATTLSKRHAMWIGPNAAMWHCWSTVSGRAARRMALAASPMAIPIATASTNSL